MEFFIQRRRVLLSCLRSVSSSLPQCQTPRFLQTLAKPPKPSQNSTAFHRNTALHTRHCATASATDTATTTATATATANLQIPKEEEEFSEEANRIISDFLVRFVALMRTKLSEAFPDATGDIVDEMLVIIVDRVVAEIEKGTFVDCKTYDAFSRAHDKGEFSEELWRIVWEVSKFIVDGIRKNEMKREINDFTRSEEMKRITKFAKSVGIHGELMREMRMHFAAEKKSQVEQRKRLERMAGKDKLSNLFRSGGRMMRLDKPWLGGGSLLPRRSGNIQFAAYGMKLSDPSWSAVGERLEQAMRLISPDEAIVLTGKSRAILNRILELRQGDEFGELFRQLNEDLKPSKAVWIGVLRRLDEAKRKDLLLKATEYLLSEESFEPTIRDYNKLIHSYAKEGRVADAERILNLMKQNQVDRDAVTCNILVTMYSKNGSLDQAREAYEKMRALGLQPGAEVYSSMVMAYIKADLPRAAEALLKEMDAKDIKPEIEVYMELLKSFSQKGLADGAQRIFNGMQFAGYMPTLESCRLLLEAYNKSGDVDQARNAFDFMMKSCLSPDDKFVACMLAAYERKNLFDKALNLLADLEKQGFKLGSESSTILIDWLGKLGLVDEAEHFLKQNFVNKEIPLALHVSMCDMYVRTGQTQKAVEILSVIENNIRNLDAVGFERLIHGFVVGGLVDEANKVFNHMKEQGLMPSEPVKIALMAAQAVADRKTGNK